jgi:hypothetical protein
MKRIKQLTAAVLITAFVASPLGLVAGDKEGVKAKSEKSAAKVKPYPLDTCIVSGEKLGADPAMKAFTFNHGDQEIKLCCKGCLKDFNKEPGKYLGKLSAGKKEGKKEDKQDKKDKTHKE